MKQNYFKNLLVANRIAVFGLIVFAGFNATYGQNPLVLPKCDSLHFISDSSRVIYYKKGKNGLYDIASKTVLIKPTKFPILHISSASIFLQFKKVGYSLDHFTESKNTFHYDAVNGAEFSAVFPAEILEKYRNIIQLNGVNYNYESGQIIDSDSLFMHDFYPETRFTINELNQKQVLVNYYRSPQEPLVLLEEIYWIDSGFAQSGVFNKQTKNWDVPPIYKTCELKDSILICSKQTPHFIHLNPEYMDPYLWYSNTYDIFVLRGESFISKAQNISQLSNEDIVNIMGWDEAEILSDSVHVIATKNGKIGFWQMDLLREFDDPQHPQFVQLNEILPIEYDYVYFNEEDGLLFSYSQNAESKVSFYNIKTNEKGERSVQSSISAKQSIYYGRDFLINTIILVDGQSIDYEAFLSNENEAIPTTNKIKRSNEAESLFRGCGLSIFNDSLIKILNFNADSLDRDAPPLASFQFPDEDSIVINPWGGWDNVYPPPIPGYDNTGVFNVNKKSWFIEPIFHDISFYNNQFLMMNVLDDEGQLLSDGDIYSLLNPEQILVFVELTLKEIWSNYSLYEPFLINEKEVKLKKPLSKQTIYSADKEKPLRKGYYAQRNDGLYEVYDINLDWIKFTIEPVSAPKELVHYNVDLDYLVYVENDSIHLEWKDTTYSVSSAQGSIEIGISRDGEEQYSFVILREGEDEETQYNLPLDPSFIFVKNISFKMIENRFIINENMFSDNLNMYYFDVEMYWEEIPKKSYQSTETETSVIWEKNKDQWKIISPFYASIEICQFGYIVSTGEQKQMNTRQDIIEEIKPRRWIFLDQDLKPMSFYDYFDFDQIIVHDFGIALSTQTGWFLISNEGIVITSAEWDMFEMEDGQVKATKYTPESLENVIYGDDLEIEKIMYYELP